VEVETEDQSNPFLQVFSPGGMEEMGLDMTSALNPFSKGQKKTQRKIPVREAREVLIENEARKRIDQSSVNREAIHRAEQSGMIFLDEVDKIAIKRGQGGPDVSREGVQRDLLPIIEGSTVTTKYGQLNTDHILFIAAGAFHESKPSDLIPELQGRLPIRVELESLTRKDFERILSEPQNAITKQYQKLLSVEGVELEFTPEALAELARLAAEVNEKMENIGARRLQTLLEKLLEQTMFDAPDVTDKKVVVDPAMVGERLSGLVEDTDLSRYIL
jgi:ATP-dependent HslUV protease ATP-binding subunit HslU